MKEYEILYDTGEARKLVAQINRMAKEGWQAISIGALGAPTGIRAVYVLIERESIDFRIGEISLATLRFFINMLFWFPIGLVFFFWVWDRDFMVGMYGDY